MEAFTAIKIIDDRPYPIAPFRWGRRLLWYWNPEDFQYMEITRSGRDPRVFLIPDGMGHDMEIAHVQQLITKERAKLFFGLGNRTISVEGERDNTPSPFEVLSNERVVSERDLLRKENIRKL